MVCGTNTTTHSAWEKEDLKRNNFQKFRAGTDQEASYMTLKKKKNFMKLSNLLCKDSNSRANFFL